MAEHSDLVGTALDDTVPDVPATTGTDTSAGLATRLLTLALLPFVATWEIGRLVVRRAIAWSPIAGRAVASVGRWVGRILAFCGRTGARILRAVGLASRLCGKGLLAFGHFVAWALYVAFATRSVGPSGEPQRPWVG